MVEMKPVAWRYSINYGPEGEEDWANLITPEGVHVANIRTHHAVRIVDGLNALSPSDILEQNASLRSEVERLTGELAEALAERDELDFLYHEGGTMESQLAASESSLSASQAEVAGLREALKGFGTSRVRDRVAARVECNHDILHDALQQEVARALATLKQGEAVT